MYELWTKLETFPQSLSCKCLTINGSLDKLICEIFYLFCKSEQIYVSLNFP